jgi:pectate lyase
MNLRNSIPRAWLSLVPVLSLAFCPLATAQPIVALQKAKVPAFPGAEGAGAYTVGGRGGKVYVVNQLSDQGPGSFREAVEAKGPRIVVFAVAGIITLEKPLAIDNPFITIAGQTAPGDGVCVRGETTAINTHDVVIRYMRFRRGELKRRDDALGGNPIGNIIIDHVSASWGLDENMSLYRYMRKVPGTVDEKLAVRNITIQWSISSEALNLNNHAFGATWGGEPCTFHHNLFACNTGRNPSIGMGGDFDFRNNVLFNWVHRTMDGGDGGSRVNVINNFYKPGPATEGELRYRICRAQARNSRDRFPGFGKWYVDGNIVDGYPKVSADNWAGGVQYDGEVQHKDEVIPAGSEEKVRASQAFPSPYVRTQSALEAYQSVLAVGGASLPKRDPVDERIIEFVRSGKSLYKDGIIDTPFDIGGWPEYSSSVQVLDKDRDGMPDEWEKEYRLNETLDSDSSLDPDKDGYTNIEEYLNGTDPNRFVDYSIDIENLSMLHGGIGK